ncbi:MAG TPA: hypothetical protein VF765_21330 [Polyangiaceae bacterium]
MTAPYRQPAPPREEPGPEPHYVPLTRKQERVRRWLRAVPVMLLAVAALYLERMWLIGAAIAWGAGVIVVERLHARSLNARLKVIAGTLARDGEPFVVSRALEALVADARPYPGFHSVALLFLGIARARGGDLDGALALLYVVQNGGWLRQRAVWQAWLLPWLSQLHAARGEMDLAHQWLDVGRAGLPADKREVLYAPEALLAMREGRHDEAIALIESYVGAAKPSDAVRGHFAFLRAYACECAGRPLPEEEVREILAARAATEGRALPVEKWWPELAAFVEKHAAPR